MAARLNRMHSAGVLERIQLSQLVTRLQNHALGRLTGASGGKGGAKKGVSRPAEMTDSQIRAACFLIERKLARAENPRDINLTHRITLEQLIAGAATASDDDAASPSIATH